MFKIKTITRRENKTRANFMPGTPQSSNVLDSRAFSIKSEGVYKGLTFQPQTIKRKDNLPLPPGFSDVLEIKQPFRDILTQQRGYPALRQSDICRLMKANSFPVKVTL